MNYFLTARSMINGWPAIPRKFFRANKVSWRGGAWYSKNASGVAKPCALRQLNKPFIQNHQINFIMLLQNKRLIFILATIVFILLVPLVAMQFTSEVNWSAADFALMGTLLLGTGLLCELVLRLVQKTSYRILLCLLLLAALFLIWAELAVGIFGSPFAGS